MSSERANFGSNHYDIFLSHSGQQKLFVTFLYHKLHQVSYRIFFDQDCDISLPKGSNLLPTILNSIKHSKMGVVVISKDFITTLWPMMELQHLFDTPGCIIYPVFYELQPGDLVNPKNLAKWQKNWEALAKKKQNQGFPINIKGWPKSLERLKLIAGTTISDGSQQILYHKLSEIVLQICHNLPPPLIYYNSFIKGKESTQKVIQDHYDSVLEESRNIGVLVLGVVGIAGSGKTTLSKTMVDYYNQHEFPGKSVLFELPTNEKDQEQLIQKIIIVLGKITRAQKSMLQTIVDIEQAVYVFQQVEQDYFLAIDNVCDWNKLIVEEILKILITSNKNDGTTMMKPKVIVTSRSKALLQRLGVVTLIDVPTIKEEEALDILLSYGKCQELYISNQISYESDIKSILKCCYLNIGNKNYAFHPLLLKTLGNIMSQIVDPKDGYGWKHCIDTLKSTCLNLMFKGETAPRLFEKDIEERIFKALEVNYNQLEETIKKLFVDIVILYIPGCIPLQNFSMFKDYRHFANMESQVNRLEYYGLWSVCRDYSNQIQGIEIHDLYMLLANKESRRNGRFLGFLDGEAIIVPSSLSKVTRIVNIKSGMHQRRSINFNHLKGLDISKLTLDNVEFVDLHAHDLKKLYDACTRCARTTTSTMSSSFQCLLSNVKHDYLGGLFGRPNEWGNALCSDLLCIIKLECGDSITRLDALGSCTPNLESLILTNCTTLKNIKGLEKLKMLQEITLQGNAGEYWEVDNAKRNYSLDVLNLSGCLELRRLEIQCFHKLKILHLPSNNNMVNVDDIGFFGRKKEIPYVALPKLEHFKVWKCEGLEVMGVLCDQNMPSLNNLSFRTCPRLKIVPRFLDSGRLEDGVPQGDLMSSFLNHFQCTTVGSNISWLEIKVNREQGSQVKGCFTDSLEYNTNGLHNARLEVTVSTEQLLFSICEEAVAVSGLTNLSILSLISNSDLSMEDSTLTLPPPPPPPSLSFLSELHGLTDLHLEGFSFIRSLDGLSCLTNLGYLILKDLAVLEDLPTLHNFYHLELIDCRSLRGLPHNFCSATILQTLRICGCPALENFQDSLNSCSCLREISSLVLDYESTIISGANNVAALDLSNLQSIFHIGLKGFPASSLCYSKWPRSGKQSLELTTSTFDIRGPNEQPKLDLSNLIIQKEMRIIGCTPSIIGWMNLCKWPPTLPELELSNVFHADELYPCLNFDTAGFAQLISLKFSQCNTVYSLGCVTCPTSLEELTFEDCKCLKDIPDISNLMNLRKIRLIRCPFVELDFERCPRLKTISVYAFEY